MVEKNSYEVMPTGIGKSAVDYILSNPEFEEDSVILDFIGGEPLIEIKRIEEICGYFVKRAEESGHRWSTNYTIRITTNGLLYNKEEVQAFLTRYNEHISVSISLDGTKRKNDTNRVFASGKGTYDSIINNVKLWIRQYPESESRMTISHDDLPFVKESVLHLLELGIKNIGRSLILPWMATVWHYPNIVHRRYMKKGTSATPCTCALNPLIFEFSDSAEAFECLSLK